MQVDAILYKVVHGGTWLYMGVVTSSIMPGQGAYKNMARQGVYSNMTGDGLLDLDFNYWAAAV